MNTWLKCLLSAGMGVAAALAAASYVTRVGSGGCWRTVFVAMVFLNIATAVIAQLPEIK